MIKPGEIYWASLDVGRHKVLVVSREDLNRGDKILVALITSQKFAPRSQLPNCVPLYAGTFGMTTNCVVQCENVFPAFVSDLDASPDAVLDETTLRDVIRAIGNVLDADCEPI